MERLRHEPAPLVMDAAPGIAGDESDRAPDDHGAVALGALILDDRCSGKGSAGNWRHGDCAQRDRAAGRSGVDGGLLGGKGGETG
jgi:hypothetical protein